MLGWLPTLEGRHECAKLDLPLSLQGLDIDGLALRILFGFLLMVTRIGLDQVSLL